MKVPHSKNVTESVTQASAPAKVIFFGEHSVNRGQPAVAAAVSLRTSCTLKPYKSGTVFMVSGNQRDESDLSALLSLRNQVDKYRKDKAYGNIQSLAAADFFAPVKYVLAQLLPEEGSARLRLEGLEVHWNSDIPVSVGLGSGAAASSSMVAALVQRLGLRIPLSKCASLAWQGDIIAHGGVASGLDSGASTFGGFIRYSEKNGVEPIESAEKIPLVVGDTGVKANTALVNEGVRRWAATHPKAKALWTRIGELALQGEKALLRGDLDELGKAMCMNHRLLCEIGISSPELDSLVQAAMNAGALGAKLSGSGGGGIMMALATRNTADDIAAAIESAGGKALFTWAGARGATVEIQD